jgi:hypothetical protein
MSLNMSGRCEIYIRFQRFVQSILVTHLIHIYEWKQPTDASFKLRYNIASCSQLITQTNKLSIHH